MISRELKAIIDKLNEQGKMIFLEGATEEQIAQFERDHGIELPEKYKEWLRYSDGGELFLPAGVQLYGVAHKPIIDVDENDRPDEKYIVIGALASGDPVLCEKSDERISIYDHEAGDIDDELTYDDFYAFLNDLYELLGIGE
ncbi:SMI1/KNR4 family protein [Adlercreutzia caecimuris]|uniref:SMI1/KNR4 family protein n=1 Tax=Adlercreutzia caecimuris TaxID=671266 RepID=UPI00039DEA82|nr:SMI1/KNR4 family protein [Adlercreutzia caecimuris]